MADQNTPSFLPEKDDLPTKRRQKFLYEALYRNVSTFASEVYGVVTLTRTI